MKVRALSLLIVSTALAAQAPVGGAGKPLPQGEDWNQLLPASFGAYHRTSLKPPTPAMDGEANYEGAGQSFFVLFGKAASPVDLKSVLTTVEQESRAPKGDLLEPELVSLKEPSLQVFRASKRGAFYAWTRGLYYFSVESKGGAPALRAFVKAFPY